MTRPYFNQSPQNASERSALKDQPKEAARKSIERVGTELDKVFARAKAVRQ